MKEFTAELVEIHIPVCQQCGQEYQLKLTTINEATQEGFGEYVPSCSCKN